MDLNLDYQHMTKDKGKQLEKCKLFKRKLFNIILCIVENGKKLNKNSKDKKKFMVLAMHMKKSI